MSFVLTSLVVVATLATVAALALGIMSMVYNGAEASPFDDEHWMAYRVILQGVALAALVATFFVST
ncbi:MAG TPA: HIG1 domain-containing protein [Casimicrobiaceae bacterium]|nr:HIG1 domain-containing protein [Casimicrobiaceae bacterium]